MNMQLRPLISTMLWCAAACSLTPSATASGNFDQGLSAYEQGQYELAFQLIRSSAEQGKTGAQYLLGTMYRRGIGVQADENKGFTWCRRAAENGLLEAQFQLGLMYYLGEGVAVNEKEAIKWLWEAADRGYPQASEVLQYVLSSAQTYDFEIGC